MGPDPRPTKIIAMWSGPRNLSTAMMRSFGARRDCLALDEPFYAAYLAATGRCHPMREAVIAAGETDPGRVSEHCLQPAPAPKTLVYQKHMTHHMIREFDTGWIAAVTNVFLIRSPARVLASYVAKTENVRAGDIGYTRQRQLFEAASSTTGQRPPVIDSADIREHPEGMLRALCAAIGIPFDPAMLSWESGPRPEDGIWAEHWYDAVWKSRGFAPAETSPPPSLPPELAAIRNEVQGDYDFMRQFRLKPVPSR